MEDKTAVAPEINRLYWETDTSVSEISNNLGVSRRALYDLIEPLPAGAACNSCGAQLYFGNRSARTAGSARCLVCGGEKELDPDISHEDVGMIPPFVSRPAAATRAAEDMRQRAALIAGFAIAGVVAGAIATLLLRRRR